MIQITLYHATLPSAGVGQTAVIRVEVDGQELTVRAEVVGLRTSMDEYQITLEVPLKFLGWAE